MQRTVVKKSKWDFAESRRSHPCTLLEKPYEIRSIIESALYGDFFNRCCSRDQQALCILYLHIQKILMRRHAHIFHGISVAAVCPGYVNTEMVQEVFQKRAHLEGMTPEEYEKTLTDAVPMGRMSEPEEVADLMAFLAGGRANYISEVTVTIAGGKTLL